MTSWRSWVGAGRTTSATEDADWRCTVTEYYVRFGSHRFALEVTTEEVSDD